MLGVPKTSGRDDVKRRMICTHVLHREPWGVRRSADGL
jgi:hypothetical protein